MSVAELIVAGFAGVFGLVMMVLGWITIEAGKGGYGYGPLPFLKVPRDNGLLLIGFAGVVIGTVLLGSAWVVIG